MYTLKTLVIVALSITLLFTGATNYSSAQAPTFQWKKCYGTSLNDKANSCQQTFDGGFIFAGNTDSLTGGDLTSTTPKGKTDVLIVKTSSTGIIQWKKRYGGSSTENINCIRQTTDSGYIFVGPTKSNNKNVSGNHGNTDIWVVKLSSTGVLQWQKCLGGTSAEDASSIVQTFDGGYIVAGFTFSNNGDVTDFNNTSFSEAWIVKLSSTGGIEWTKCFGGSYAEVAYSVIQTADSNYAFLATSQSNDSDVVGHSIGTSNDYWVVKIDQLGNILSSQCYGGTGDDSPHTIAQTFDGGYIIGGYSNSTDGNVTGNHGGYDYWVLKIDQLGNILWQKSFGGTGTDLSKGVSQTSDSGYIVIGNTYSVDGQVTGNHSNNADIWMLKIGSGGTIKWKKCFGGTAVDNTTGPAWQTTDGGYIFCASTNSTDGNVSGGHGLLDFWMVKLNPSASRFGEELEEENAYLVYPNPARDFVNIQFKMEADDGVIEIYDLLGNIVFWQNIESPLQIISIGRLGSGMYVLRIGNFSKKIIKE